MESSSKNSNSNSNLNFSFNRSHSVHSSAGDFFSSTKPYPYPASHNSNSLRRDGSFTKSYDYSSLAGDFIKGKVKKLSSFFEKSYSSSKLIDESRPQIRSPRSPTEDVLEKKKKSLGSDDDEDYRNWRVPDFSSSPLLPGTEDRVVVYFTSLRSIRRTYEDCCTVMMILNGFRVMVDERDISMDSAYKKELQQTVLGAAGKNHLSLPQVFIRGHHIGGAEVIKHFHEIGELGKMLKGLPIRPLGGCKACANVRFIPCFNCNGSRKVYDEDEDQLKRCLYCNENGLIRCPTCCSS